MVQVLPEVAPADLLQQVLVGGGDQQHTADTLLVLSEAEETAVIQEAEQLYLGFRIGISDFIQKNDSARRLLEDPFPIAVGAGERPLLVAE